MMKKTTLYLSDDLKRAVEREAVRSGRSEAEVIRAAIAAFVGRPKPRSGLFEAEPLTDRVDDLLDGFGER